MSSTRAIPSEALSQHIAVLGKTGSGKSSTSRLCVEQVVAEGFRVCILDTIKSDWWGITSSADGKKPGLPFKILGGPRGHVPLHSSAGKALGQLVGEGKLPLSIIDMADFEPGGVQKFFSDFAPALMRHAKGVLYLVIEEAHEVAPKERAGFGAENMAIHWAKKLATAGRSKGIRLSEAIGIVERLNDLRLAAFRAGGFDTPAAKAYYRALSTAFQREELVDAAEISRLTARIAELEQRLKPFAVTADTWTVQNAAHCGILLTLSNGERMCAMDASDFIAARTTLEASERGGGE